MMRKYVSSLFHSYLDDGKILRGKWRCHEGIILMMGKYVSFLLHSYLFDGKICFILVTLLFR